MNYEIKKGVLGQKVVVKFPPMRKEQEFCIYPTNYSEKFIYLQASKQCCKINKATFSNKGTMPMDYFLTFKVTHKFNVEKQFITDILTALNNDKRIEKDGSIVVDFSAV